VRAIGSSPEAVAAADAAARQMQAVWARILSGEMFGAEFVTMLKDTQEPSRHQCGHAHPELRRGG
jgi:hypothetical protein